MVRALLEQALPAHVVDDVFERTAREQYTGTLLFSSVVELLGLAVCKIRPSVHAAYQARSDAPGVSLAAVYDKLAGVEPEVSAALVRASSRRLEPVMAAVGSPAASPLPGYAVRILDGNYLARTQHRLRVLRRTRAAALPGMSIVVLDPQSRVACDFFPCENAHAQERALLGQVLGRVEAGQVWIGDRNFCVPAFLAGLRARGAGFVIRQHRSTLSWEGVTPLAACGRTATGDVLEQPVRLLNVAGRPVVRRVLVRLDQPTQDGDTEIAILTDLPGAVSPRDVAAAYRERWSVEGLFFHLSTALACEVATLAYPRAALLGFALALVANNLLAVVQAALAAVHGAEKIRTELSFYYVAEELAGTSRGMMIAIPEPEWAAFGDLSAAALAGLLRRWAAGVRLAAYRKHPRGPKKPQPERPRAGRFRHVATAKLLAKRDAPRPNGRAP
jgi:IS4 transposase